MPYVEFVNNKIKQLNETHISSSVNKKDAFSYLMEDSEESSSENDIDVLGINDFPESPHQVNKKAYTLKLLFEKDSPNQYRSRLGFNLHPLPVGYYSMIIEWFPPEMNEVSVTPQATTISISNCITKKFEKYTKTLIHFHRWSSSPPQYIFLDLHGTVRHPPLIIVGHLIVYGLKETVSNVDPSVYDTAFVTENGQMVMQTDLSLNGHRLRGFEKYTKTLIHFHRWSSSPPQYIFLDLHGTVRHPSLIIAGHLIVYGLKETVSNVDPSVYDTAFVTENGQMVMQTDLSLNGHRLRGFVHYINGFLNTKNGNTFLLNGCDKIIIPNHSHILTIKVLYFNLKSQYTPISLKIKHSFHLTQSNTYTSTQATQLQTLSINLKLAFGLIAVELASIVTG